MKWRWLNNGEPDENGDYEMVIENSAGNRVSTFKGKNKDEIITGLANSQVQANRRLGELLKPDKAQPPQPAPVSQADRERMSNGMTDPAQVVETVTEITTRSQKTQADQDAYYRDEANAFVASHPDYYPTAQNQSLLFKGLQDRGYDLTRTNLAIVFGELTHMDALETWPDDGEGDDAPEPVATPPRRREGGSNVAVEEPPKPVSRSTGLRNSDANASRPAPPKPKPIVTRAELEKMSRQEYQEKLRDPAFRKAVDELQ
jgi:hypothetical protein